MGNSGSLRRTGCIQLRHGEFCTGQEGGICAVRALAAELHQADTRFILFNGERTALISRTDIKLDAFFLRRTTSQRGIVHQRNGFGAHRLGSFHLIGQLQVGIIRHIQLEALAILCHFKHIGAGGGRAAPGHLQPRIHVDKFEGVFQVDEYFRAGAHAVFQQDHVAVFLQIQPVGVHLNGVAHLVAGRLHELGGLVQNNFIENCRVRGGETVGAITVPAGGEGVGVFNGQGRCILALCIQLIQHLLQRIGREDGVIINLEGLARFPVDFHPTTDRYSKGEGEGFAIVLKAVRHNDIITIPDQELILQRLPGVNGGTPGYRRSYPLRSPGGVHYSG